MSQLFVWLGVSATLVPILLTWALVGSGLNATAIAVVLVSGYLVSGVLISVAAIAGKRSGLSTAIISRAVFGVWGNSIPLAVGLIIRVALTAVMLGVFAFLLNGLDARAPEFSVNVVSFSGVNITFGLILQLVVLLAIALLVLVEETFLESFKYF
jgi:purine-cytosine permease-like protein